MMQSKTEIKKAIPRGYYCYSYNKNGEREVCPYWSRRDDLPEQENGFCSYLGKSDWDLNEEKYLGGYWQGGKWFAYDSLKSPHDIGFPMSLLWDMCKECDVKRK